MACRLLAAAAGRPGLDSITLGSNTSGLLLRTGSLGLPARLAWSVVCTGSIRRSLPATVCLPTDVCDSAISAGHALVRPTTLAHLLLRRLVRPMCRRQRVLVRELPHRRLWLLSSVCLQSSSIRSQWNQFGPSTGELEPILHQQPRISPTANLCQSASVRTSKPKPTILEFRQHRRELSRPCVAK